MNTIPYGEDELARPLSDAELDELEAFFASEACRDCGLTLSAVDGFLAALASSPINLQPEQWQPQLWGDSLPFQAADQERRITRLLQRQLNDISWRLREEPDSWEPVLYQHGVPGREMLDGAEWSWGYLLCVDSWREDWEPLFEDPVGEALEPMYLLGTEELEDEDKALVKTAVQRHTYAKKLRESVLAIHRWGAPRRPPLVETVRRDTAKVGRNDPCPCGSGKKYKKCCGAEGQPA